MIYQAYQNTRLPRMRGDRPRLVDGQRRLGLFTPHARGSTQRSALIVISLSVYPACAGIDPLDDYAKIVNRSLPRMRGDRPFDTSVIIAGTMFTPHARGSTVGGRARAEAASVYPACAGIDPGQGSGKEGCLCLPRMRGDRPLATLISSPSHEFTPHARGSTLAENGVKMTVDVYPACAGIDRTCRSCIRSL